MNQVVLKNWQNITRKPCYRRETARCRCKFHVPSIPNYRVYRQYCLFRLTLLRCVAHPVTIERYVINYFYATPSSKVFICCYVPNVHYHPSHPASRYDPRKERNIVNERTVGRRHGRKGIIALYGHSRSYTLAPDDSSCVTMYLLTFALSCPVSKIL